MTETRKPPPTGHPPDELDPNIPPGNPSTPVTGEDVQHGGTHQQRVVDDPPGKEGHQGMWNPDQKPPDPEYAPGTNPPGTNPPVAPNRDPATHPIPGSVPGAADPNYPAAPGPQGQPQQGHQDHRSQRQSEHNKR